MIGWFTLSMKETNQWASDCSLPLRDGPWQKIKIILSAPSVRRPTGKMHGMPDYQSSPVHKAIGSNILSEFEETFLLKILNAFHSRQRFSCVTNFLWLSTKLKQSYPLPPTWFLLQVPFSNCSTRSHCTNVQISCNETH